MSMTTSKEYSFISENVPPEVADRFNWGAFLAGWIWGFRYKVWFMLVEPILLLIIALFWGIDIALTKDPDQVIHFSTISVTVMLFFLMTFIPVRLFAGKVGNIIAWNYYEHSDINQFNDRQINWALLGTFICIFSLPIFVPVAIRVFVLAMTTPHFLTMSTVTVILLNFFMYFVVKYIFKIYYLSKNS